MWCPLPNDTTNRLGHAAMLTKRPGRPDRPTTSTFHPSPEADPESRHRGEIREKNVVLSFYQAKLKFTNKPKRDSFLRFYIISTTCIQQNEQNPFGLHNSHTSVTPFLHMISSVTIKNVAVSVYASVQICHIIYYHSVLIRCR